MPRRICLSALEFRFFAGAPLVLGIAVPAPRLDYYCPTTQSIILATIISLTTSMATILTIQQMLPFIAFQVYSVGFALSIKYLHWVFTTTILVITSL